MPGSAQYGVKAFFFDVFGTLERRKIGPPSGIVGNRHQHADAAHLLALLRTHRKRPRRRTLSCPRQPLSRGSSPCGYPHEPLVSYRINRQLSEWNSSSTGNPRLRGALPLADQVHCNTRRAYSTALGVSTILGSRIVKVEPRPSSLSTVMSPPII